jgi:hypothetical protein
MKLIASRDLEAYLKDDVIQRRLERSASGCETLTCHAWLTNTPAKRMIFQHLYGELFTTTGVKILDIGGGLTGLTPEFVRRHDYNLVDILAHDRSAAEAMSQEVGRSFLTIGDWSSVHAGPQDLVIANDLFPNVDQRLDLFLHKYLPLTRRLRLSLTYYDEPRFYLTKRIDADEILCMLAWDSRQLRHALKPYEERIVDFNPRLIGQEQPSLYANNRQVCLVEMRGDLDAT